MKINSTFVTIGSLCALLSVAIGAFGAHGLEGRLTADMMENYQTGVQYQMMHSLGLLVVGLLSGFMPESGHLRRAGWSMLIGIIVFSGSLYVLSITGITKLGMITPIGGVAFIFGWLSLILAARKKG